MSSDELENLISRNLDGLLSPAEQADLEAELARNPDARELAEEYQNVNQLLLEAPIPELDYFRLADQISAAIAEADAAERAHGYSFPMWARWTVGLAAAACIALAMGAWVEISRPLNSAAASTAKPVQVAVLGVHDQINREPIRELQIGPRPGMAHADLSAREALTAPRSTVAIDTAAPAAQDSDFY